MKYLFTLLVIIFISCSTRFTYEDAEKRGTIDGYYRFITENPDSNESEQAISKVKDILFTRTLQKRDVILIKRFLSEFPQDSRAQTLRDLLDEIRFEEVKKSRDRDAIEIFIHKASNKKLKEDARLLLEEMDYEKIKGSDDIKSIEAFIKRYPQSPHCIELNDRLMQILYKRIKGGDLFFAEEFISRFPESGKRLEINRILIENIFNFLSTFCLLDGFEKINILYDGKGDDIEMFKNVLKDKEIQCTHYYNLFEKISSGKASQKEIKRIFLSDITEREKKTILNLFKNYIDAYNHLKTIYNSLDSEDPEKRRLAYLYIKSFPFSLKTAVALIAVFMNSTLLERLEIYQTIKNLVIEEENRSVFNSIFFANREKPFYVVTRNIFLRSFTDFEKDNEFLNKSFLDAKEDVLLQFLIIELAYENGYNTFIKSVTGEHIKQLFSLLSEIQSLCQEECSKKKLFDLKGAHQILQKELEIFKTILGDKSDVTGLLIEKEKEISKILGRYRFAPEMPVVKNPSEGVDIGILKMVVERPILVFFYQAEPDIANREKIKKLILNYTLRD